jgi:hypothetical protein
MVKQVTVLSGAPSPDTTLRTDAWQLARKRADDYLKLHRIPDAEREHLLSQIAHKLTRTPPCNEQELIQLFISTVRAELAAVQPPITKPAVTEVQPEADESDVKAEARAKTGPRFERSSIRVAPLQAITLRLLRLRQRHTHH